MVRRNTLRQTTPTTVPPVLSLAEDLPDNTDSSDSSFVDHASDIEEEAMDNLTCRVCREPGSTSATDENETLIAPCQCRGTMKWVHRRCWNDTCQQRCIPCGLNVAPQVEGEDGALHIDISGIIDELLPMLAGPRTNAPTTGIVTVVSNLAESCERIIRDVAMTRGNLMSVVAKFLDSMMVKAFLCFLMVYTAIILSLHLLLAFQMTMRVFTTGSV